MLISEDYIRKQLSIADQDLERARQLELAWAAGFFDGEGCTDIQHRHGPVRSYKYVRLQVSQKDRRALDRWVDAIGLGKVRGPYEKARGDYYRISLSDKEARAALKLMHPYLGTVKREQAARVLNECA
jgi:hypothetical protein